VLGSRRSTGGEQRQHHGTQKGRSTHFEEANHGLQAADETEIDPILERREHDDAAGNEALPVGFPRLVRLGRHPEESKEKGSVCCSTLVLREVLAACSRLGQVGAQSGCNTVRTGPKRNTACNVSRLMYYHLVHILACRSGPSLAINMHQSPRSATNDSISRSSTPFSNLGKQPNAGPARVSRALGEHPAHAEKGGFGSFSPGERLSSRMSASFSGCWRRGAKEGGEKAGEGQRRSSWHPSRPLPSDHAQKDGTLCSRWPACKE
jgi:hypothetical protein